MIDTETDTIRRRPDLLALLQSGAAFLLYKHSPWCFRSQRAALHMRHFSEQTRDVPVVQVDVIRERALSEAIEEGTTIRHESPQALLFHGGAVLWHASHGHVTSDNLTRAVATLPKVVSSP